jgi:hypothetical protein
VVIVVVAFRVIHFILCVKRDAYAMPTATAARQKKLTETLNERTNRKKKLKKNYIQVTKYKI